MPSFLGVRTLFDYPLNKLVPYIDWAQFFAAWEMRGKFPEILDHPERGIEARKLYDTPASRSTYRRNAGYGQWRLCLLAGGLRRATISSYTTTTRGRRKTPGFSICGSSGRPKTRKTLSSATPTSSPPSKADARTIIGGFAVTGGLGTDRLVRRFEADHDDYNSIMVKVIADRLAEAFAERLHEIVRQDWGFGQDENLTVHDMLDEKYRGMRPAPGYPSVPDHTENGRSSICWAPNQPASHSPRVS